MKKFERVNFKAFKEQDCQDAIIKSIIKIVCEATSVRKKRRKMFKCLALFTSDWGKCYFKTWSKKNVMCKELKSKKNKRNKMCLLQTLNATFF